MIRVDHQVGRFRSDGGVVFSALALQKEIVHLLDFWSFCLVIALTPDTQILHVFSDIINDIMIKLVEHLRVVCLNDHVLDT